MTIELLDVLSFGSSGTMGVATGPPLRNGYRWGWRLNYIAYKWLTLKHNINRYLPTKKPVRVVRTS